MSETRRSLCFVRSAVWRRIRALAGAGEVWVSSTVKDLTARSGLAYEYRGEHALKGVPDAWHLYRVARS